MARRSIFLAGRVAARARIRLLVGATVTMLALSLAAAGRAGAQGGHSDIAIYSTASGGGALTTDGTLPPALVFPSVCLGAFCLFSATDPGFVTNDEPAGPGFFPLAAGTTVIMEIVSMADEVSVLVGGKLLDDAGETASLGTAPGLHLHPTWQITVPSSGGTASSFLVTFRLTSSSPYAASSDLTLTLTLPAPAPTPTAVPTPSPVATVAPTATPTPTPRPTATPVVSATAGPTPSVGPTSVPTPRPTPSPAATAAPTRSPAGTATPAESPDPTAAPSPTSGASATPRPTVTPRATPAATPTPSPAATPMPTATTASSPAPTPRSTLTPAPAPGAIVEQPTSRGDQVLFYLDARAGFTSFLSVANVGAAALDVRIDVYAADLTLRDTLALALPAGGSSTIDVAVLRDAGVVSGPGLAIAYAVDESGAPVVSRALAGNFTVANLATGSAWGAPGVARSARSADGGHVPPGAVIDSAGVLLDQIRPDAVELAVYHDPDTLESAADGGNQLVFLSFDDVGGRAPAVRGAAMRWVASATQRDGDVLPSAAVDTSGVDVSHLEAVVGPEVRGAAGHLQLTARTPSAGNRLVFFAQSLGTFATGYLLPPAR